MTCSHRLNLLAVLLLLCLTGCVSDVEFDHEDDETTSDPSTLTNPLSSLGAIEVYWNREANGTYALRALAPASVAKVEYRVDGHLIAAPARQGSKDNFPASYRFSQEGTGRAFEVKGLDAKGKTVALGVGAIDVTAGTAFYIKQMGRGLFEVGLERGPQGVAAVEVEVDGRWVLTDQVTGRQRSDRMAVRSLFGGIGPRTFALKTYGSDGRLRGTITRQFDLSGGRATPQPPSVACSGTPAIVSRSSWGARSYRGGTSSLGRPTRITIHHEGAGVSRPASTRGAQAMRDTQAFHQNGNGWADLGYHYVIMPDGGIYQGRATHRGGLALGSHAYGANSNNIGVMLFGDFSLQQPTQAQLSAAAHLVAHLSSRYGLTPQVDRTLFGHRDFGGTSCPGANLYAKLSLIAKDAKACMGN